MLSKSQPEVTIRAATPDDSAICGQICYDAFLTINTAHGFPCDFPGPEATTHLLSMMFSSPGFYCVVAEIEGRVVGSNCLYERSTAGGVGPITVDPSAQHVGVGRKLMQAVINRANGRNAGLRLVQAAFHNRSLALYTSLGFDVREPLSCVQGRTHERAVSGCVVRAAQTSDLDACNALSRRVHGYDRGAELTQATGQKTALVVERGGRVTGYASALAFSGHATAETNLDMQALIASAESFGGPGILVPSRNSALLRWCLENGLRIVQPMTLMSTGLYNEASGAWLPSILF
jgi:GNAT superfamily N-acetyltransferase